MNLSNYKKGFTLVELMISITVLGIIAALSIPVYQEYVTRSQVAESVALFDGKRVGAEDFLHLNGFENSKTFSNIGPLRSEYIEMGMEAYDSNYYNIAFLYGANSNKNLQGKSILFFNETSEKDNILWECETNIAQKYLPNNLKCTVLNIPGEPENPGGGTDDDHVKSSCDANTLPDIKDMPDMDGYGKMYDAKYNQYLYYKDIGEGKIVYGEYNNSYMDKNGNSVFYNPKNGIITSFTDSHGNYIRYDGGVSVSNVGFGPEYRAVEEYRRAVAEVARLDGKAMTDREKQILQYYKDGLNDGSFKAEADKFFSKYEDTYIKDGVLDPDTPQLLKEFYDNTDKDNFAYNGSGLLDINNYPEIQENDYEFDFSQNFFPVYSCEKEGGII